MRVFVMKLGFAGIMKFNWDFFSEFFGQLKISNRYSKYVFCFVLFIIYKLNEIEIKYTVMMIWAGIIWIAA